MSVVDELEKEMEGTEEIEDVIGLSAEETAAEEAEGLNEEELRNMDRDTLLDMQDFLLEQVWFCFSLIDSIAAEHLNVTISNPSMSCLMYLPDEELGGSI